MKTTTPSLSRNAFMSEDLKSEPSDWHNIGGLDEIKSRLEKLIEMPRLHSDKMKRFGVESPKGILLYGSPGSAKTTLVRSLAHYLKTSFFSLNGSNLYSSFVGESERTVREIFLKARQTTPSIIFLDEIEALVAKRSLGEESGNDVGKRILSTILNEVDGVSGSKGITLIAATNRPDMVDSALMRPGRFDKIVYVGLPDALGRLQILKLKTQKMIFEADVDLAVFASDKYSFRYSGADLEHVVREAAMNALRRNNNTAFLKKDDLILAFNNTAASTSEKLLNDCIRFQKVFGSGYK